MLGATRPTTRAHLQALKGGPGAQLPQHERVAVLLSQSTRARLHPRATAALRQAHGKKANAAGAPRPATSQSRRRTASAPAPATRRPSGRALVARRAHGLAGRRLRRRGMQARAELSKPACWSTPVRALLHRRLDLVLYVRDRWTTTPGATSPRSTHINMLGSAPLRAAPRRAARAPPARALSRPDSQPASVRAPGPARPARPRRRRRRPAPPSARAGRWRQPSAGPAARRTAAGSARPARRPPRARRSRGSPGGPARRGRPRGPLPGQARLAGRAPGEPRHPTLTLVEQNAAGRLRLVSACQRTTRQVHACAFACRRAAATREVGRFSSCSLAACALRCPACGGAAREVPLGAAPQQGPRSSTGSKETL